MKHLKRRTSEQWESLIQEQEQSDLSQRAFCTEHNIAYPSFTKWRQKLKGGDKAFLPITSPKQNNDNQHFSLSLGWGKFSLTVSL